MPAPVIATGTSFAFATTAFVARFTSVQPPQQTRESINTSHLGTTGAEEYIPNVLFEGGELTCNIQFDPGLTPPIDQPVETITVTFPGGETWEFQGFMTAYQPTGDLGALMTATVTWKVANDIAYTT